jgi:hypothetical protein
MGRTVDPQHIIDSGRSECVTHISCTSPTASGLSTTFSIGSLPVFLTLVYIGSARELTLI